MALAMLELWVWFQGPPIREKLFWRKAFAKWHKWLCIYNKKTILHSKNISIKYSRTPLLWHHPQQVKTTPFETQNPFVILCLSAPPLSSILCPLHSSSDENLICWNWSLWNGEYCRVIERSASSSIRGSREWGDDRDNEGAEVRRGGWIEKRGKERG